MRLVFMGAPGAGKGTQAKLLAARYGVKHVSTGDILRGHMIKGDEIGLEIKDVMQSGGLVPDSIVAGIIKPFVETGRFIFDGFPRTLSQAFMLDEMLERNGMGLDRVFYVTITDDIIIERMSGRHTCPFCGAIYNTLFNKPGEAGTCDKCGGTLTVRDDDSEPVVRRRLAAYYNLTEPIIEHYRGMGLVSEISGFGEINDVTKRIEAEIAHRRGGG